MVTLACLVLLALLAPAAPPPGTPLIIGHRGASGHRPEHTLEAYTLAVEMGADFIEPDLVSTKDGVLIARHENEIGGTTDVAERFPDRKRTKTIDGQSVTGWFTEDFTLAEIKTLRARERLPFRSHQYDGRFAVATLDEVIELAQRLRTASGPRSASIRKPSIPATSAASACRSKNGCSPRWRNTAGTIVRRRCSSSRSRPATCATCARRPTVRLIQLLSPAVPFDDPGLKAIAGYADGIGPEKKMLVPVAADGSLKPATDLVDRAHRAGLLVHVWTVRTEPQFLPAGYKGDVRAEFLQLRQLGVDGVFTDFPDAAAAAYRDNSGGRGTVIRVDREAVARD